MESYPLTLRGARLLREELKELTEVRRPNVIKAIAEAREHGDLKENSEYHAAREEQSLVEARITYLESLLASANVIDLNEMNISTVVFGSKVKLLNLDTDEVMSFRIVGEDEADVEKERISYRAPICRSIIGKEVGDDVKLMTPKGEFEFEIIEIDHTNEDINAD